MDTSNTAAKGKCGAGRQHGCLIALPALAVAWRGCVRWAVPCTSCRSTGTAQGSSVALLASPGRTVAQVDRICAGRTL